MMLHRLAFWLWSIPCFFWITLNAATTYVLGMVGVPLLRLIAIALFADFVRWLFCKHLRQSRAKTYARIRAVAESRTEKDRIAPSAKFNMALPLICFGLHGVIHLVIYWTGASYLIPRPQLLSNILEAAHWLMPFLPDLSIQDSSSDQNVRYQIATYMLGWILLYVYFICRSGSQVALSFSSWIFATKIPQSPARLEYPRPFLREVLASACVYFFLLAFIGFAYSALVPNNYADAIRATPTGLIFGSSLLSMGVIFLEALYAYLLINRVQTVAYS